MTSAGSQAVNPMSAAQHMFGIGAGVAPSAGNPAAALGPEPGTLQTNPFDRVQHQNYDYPEAVKDQTLFVKSTIEGFIMEDIEWMTTLALPWAETNQISITWNEWKFTNPLADRVPHEGVSRLITSTKRQFKTHVVRRGLAFTMEADYANTAEGIEQYALNVMSIGQAVQETQNHDTVFALLTCKNYQKMWQQRFGTASVSLSQIEDNEIATFGSVCLPEGDDRLSKVIEDHKRIMRKQGVIPNMLILWPGATIYMSMVPPQRTSYDKAGPDGVARREIGPDSLTVFRNLPVFEARDFDVYEDSPPIQLLTRPVQISEYYTMRFDRRNEDVSDYETKERGIVIYDENTNQWKKIGFMEAFKNANLFNSEGNYSRKLTELVNVYRAESRRPHREKMSADAFADDEMEEIEESTADADVAPSFFLTAPDNAGEYMLLRYFGQMEMQHMSPEDVQRIAETIASGLRGPKALDTWRDMVRLVNDIEAQTYNHVYFAALIAANTRDSVSNEGAFIGELTPNDVAEHWGIGQKQRQLKPNAYGSLRLPQDANMRDVGFPAGFANGPGLQTLAAEARNPTSPWQRAGERARAAVDLLQYIIDHLRMRTKNSAALDVKGRSPWFHRADALATFFETVVGVQRDPLFLASLPASDADMLNDADAMGDTGAYDRARSLRWFSLPGTIHTIRTDEVIHGAEEAIAHAVRNPSKTTVEETRGLGGFYTGLNRDEEEGMVSFFSPTTMTNVSVRVEDFAKVVRFTPEVQAFGVLPGGDTQIEKDVRMAYYNTVAGINDAETRRKLIDFVYNMGLTKNRAKMWRVVYSLPLLRGDDLVSVVDLINLSDAPTRAEISAARAKTSELAESAPTADWESFGVLAAKWEPFTADIATGGISFQETADDVQRVLDLERDLLAVSVGGDFTGEGALNAASFNDVTATAGNEDVVGRLVGAIRGILERIEETMPREARGEAVRRASGGASRRRVTVTESPTDVLDARYYRTPLTSSLHLVQSMSDMFGQHGVAKPLVLPSDPNTGHTMPYMWDTQARGDANTRDVFARPNYDAAHISSSIGAAMSSPNYSTLSELLSDRTKRRLDDTGFVKRHETAGFTVASSSTSAASSMHFDDADDDYDSEEDDLAQVFGRDGASTSSFSKRARAGALIGAHATDEHEPLLHRAEHKYTRTGVFAKRWTHANDIADPLVRICAHVFLMTNCEEENTWTAMIQNDVLVPMDFILWRPLIVHDMSSAILMKGGRETGANLHGGSNVAKGNDVTSKLIYYNFTFRSKAIVWKEKNVAIIENLKFESYGGGMSTGFIKKASDLDREDQKRPSIIVTAIPIGEKSLEKRLDFSGRMHVPQVNVDLDGPITWQYSSSEYYDRLCYKLSSHAADSDPEHEDFYDRADRTVLASYQGTQFCYNRNSSTYSRFVEPQGHLKRNMCYPGAAEVLNGTAMAFEKYNYELGTEHFFLFSPCKR